MEYKDRQSNVKIFTFKDLLFFLSTYAFRAQKHQWVDPEITKICFQVILLLNFENLKEFGTSHLLRNCDKNV